MVEPRTFQFKRVIYKVLFLSLGLVSGLLAAEIILRLFLPQPTAPVQYSFDPQLGSIPVPNANGTRTLPGVYNFTYRNDANGLRVNEGCIKHSSARHTILMLGDSFTYGVGVNDDQTFSYYMERKLCEEGSEVDIVNAGNGGKGTDYALKFFQTRGVTIKPDLTILNFVSNDFQDNELSAYFSLDKSGNLIPKTLGNSMAAEQRVFWKSRVYDWFITHSHVANLIKQVAIRMFVRSFRQRQHEISHIVYYKKDKAYSSSTSFELTKRLLLQLKLAVNNTGSKFVVFYIPTLDEVNEFRTSGTASKDEKLIASITNDEKILFVSLTSSFAHSHLSTSKLYFISDGHWTASAHLLASQIMLDALNDSSILKN